MGPLRGDTVRRRRWVRWKVHRDATPSDSPPRRTYAIGKEVQVRSKKGVERLCTVVDVGEGKIKIHYEGFAEKHDEWLELSSDRILAPTDGAAAAGGVPPPASPPYDRS